MNDTIFHATSFQSASNFLEYNGLKTSDLLLNKSELEITKQITPKQYLYYTSFARSLTSGFINSTIPQTILHLNKRYIKNLGTLTPLKFPHLAPNYDEMEDRLLTNLPIIPLKAITQISIIIPEHTIEQETFHLANLLNNTKVKTQTYTSIKHITKNQPTPFHTPTQPIPKQQLDGSEAFIHFLQTNQLPKHPEILSLINYEMFGTHPTLTSFLNLAHPNNLKHWHLIRLYAKHHNLKIKDLYKKLFEYRSLVREQYNPY